MARIVLAEGDLTESAVDAIVNAANTDLVLGAGVAGAIRAKGGPSIQSECDAYGPIPLGQAALTGAGALSARYVIHAAAMHLGGQVTEASLRDATRSALQLAAERGVRSLAFPALGTGIGGFPVQRCAEIMLEETRSHLSSGASSLEEVRFVLYGEPAYRIFEMVNDAEKVRAAVARLRK